MEHCYLGIDVGKAFSRSFGLTPEGEVVCDGKQLRTMQEDAWRQWLQPLSEKYVLHAAFEIGPLYLMLVVSLKDNTQFYQAPATVTQPLHWSNWSFVRVL